jgi:hypothetical protein
MEGSNSTARVELLVSKGRKYETSGDQILIKKYHRQESGDSQIIM